MIARWRRARAYIPRHSLALRSLAGLPVVRP